MTYPTIVMVIAILVVIFLLIRVVPTFADMFKEQGAELPWVTKFVMSASNFVVHQWWIVLLILISIIVVFRLYLQTAEGKMQIDRLTFKIPIMGAIIKKALIARMARTLSALFISGVSVLEAIEITANVVGNKVFLKVLLDAKRSLEEGKQLSEPLEKSGLFPLLVIQMVSIGEETGQIEKMLLKIAEFYEDEVDQSVDQFKATIEPLLLLVVSMVVGFIVSSIMAPMFKMYENFSK